MSKDNVKIPSLINPLFFVPEPAFVMLYDDIVDEKNFKSTKQLIKDMTAHELNSSPTAGLYDYPKGSKGHEPTDVELLLRSGKLDKADVQKLKELEKSSLVAESEEQALQAELKASKSRTARIDKILEQQSAGLA